jgi:hypothetical protein
MRHPALLALPVSLLLLACGKGELQPSPVASGSAPLAAGSGSAAPVETYGVPIGLPGDPKKVVDAVNPKHEKPYAGPTGTLKGRVVIKGDAPPDTNLKFPDKCRDSAATYGKLFRKGLDDALADAMVAVTGYQGFVPASGPAAKVTIQGCAAKKRTIVMTAGQRLEVANLDRIDSYIPVLDGAPSAAGMVAVPGGDAVKLYPREPGRYMLRDMMPSGLVADIYVLKYATHDVTGLDGEYEIKGLPVGKARVDAFLPVIGKGAGKDIEIKEGENKLDLELSFDAKKDLPGAAPAPSGSASAGPAPSVSPADKKKIPR